jgi:hypothetical protein
MSIPRWCSRRISRPYHPSNRRLGFIASHCILQLLAVGLQVRSLRRAGEVRAMLKQGSAEAANHLSFFAANLEKDVGWP